MSAPLAISSIDFLNNPAKWKDNFKVAVTMEAHEDLPKDAEWQLIYVGSADESFDQVLESVVVGPIVKGRHKFEFEAPAPDDTKIPPENIHDINLVLLKCFYDGKMFSKIGWFVTNEYEEEELQLNKPPMPLFEKLKREIQTEHVRVTNYATCWRDEEPPVIENLDESDIAFAVTADGQQGPEDEDLEGSEDDDEEEGDDTVDLSADVSGLGIVNDENNKARDVAMEEDGGKGDAEKIGGADVFAEKTNVEEINIQH